MTVYDTKKAEQLSLEQHLGLKRQGYGVQNDSGIVDPRALGEANLAAAWRKDLEETLNRQTHDSARSEIMTKLKEDRRRARALIKCHPNRPGNSTTFTTGSAAQGTTSAPRTSAFTSPTSPSVAPLTSVLSQSANVALSSQLGEAQPRTTDEIRVERERLENEMDEVWTNVRKLHEIVSTSDSMRTQLTIDQTDPSKYAAKDEKLCADYNRIGARQEQTLDELQNSYALAAASRGEIYVDNRVFPSKVPSMRQYRRSLYGAKFDAERRGDSAKVAELDQDLADHLPLMLDEKDRIRNLGNTCRSTTVRSATNAAATGTSIPACVPPSTQQYTNATSFGQRAPLLSDPSMRTLEETIWELVKDRGFSPSEKTDLIMSVISTSANHNAGTNTCGSEYMSRPDFGGETGRSACA